MKEEEWKACYNCKWNGTNKLKCDTCRLYTNWKSRIEDNELLKAEVKLNTGGRVQIISATEIDYDNLPMDLAVVFDTENISLLDETAIDYSSVPYKLRDSFKNHCYICIELTRDVVYTFVQEEIDKYFPKFAAKVSHWVGQNSINYDHLVLKLAQGLDYTIEPDTLNGKPVKIDDTLVMSKMLNPDRPGHSLEYAGQILGYPKIDWRSEAIELGLIDKHEPSGAEFKTYHPRMLNYCIRDCEVNRKWYFYLLKEWGDWNWSDAYSLEKSVAEIITRQSHRGFKFDIELAKANLDELDKLMEDIRLKVEPTLPPKKATKTLQKEYTPPATQFLKNGEPSSYIKKFAERIGGEIVGTFEEGYRLIFNSQEHSLPFNYPLINESPMTLADSTQIKEYLVKDFKWQPTSYKERDLTTDAKKKKISREKFLIAAEKYIEQTLESPFCEDRCDHLGCKPSELRAKILAHDVKKPLKVLTNPSFTVGQEKDLCPGLDRIAKDYPHAQAVAHWLTYRHRRNSILGGGVDYDDEENINKGFLNFVRQDGRISTPADTCGASSRRMLHRVVSNIPRVETLYGHNMRAMFGVDRANCYLIGADFTSLEAMEEAHYTFKYPNGKEYGESLTREKPNSIHCVNSRKLNIPRSEAKMVKYLLGYGGQPPKLAKATGWSLSKSKSIFNGFWEEAKPLKLLIDNLTKYWENVGEKKFILGLDGSKIQTRSKHSLLNSLLQSAGAICAKRQMVIFDKKLKEAKLSVDFFKEDWTIKPYAQQLIAYHDELEVEVSKSLVTIQKFNSKEEAEKVLDNSINYLLEKNGKYFIIASIIGKFLKEAAIETSEYYKMKVSLGMDFAVHYDWSGTH